MKATATAGVEAVSGIDDTISVDEIMDLNPCAEYPMEYWEAGFTSCGIGKGGRLNMGALLLGGAALSPFARLWLAVRLVPDSVCREAAGLIVEGLCAYEARDVRDEVSGEGTVEILQRAVRYLWEAETHEGGWRFALRKVCYCRTRAAEISLVTWFRGLGPVIEWHLDYERVVMVRCIVLAWARRRVGAALVSAPRAGRGFSGGE